MVPSTSRNSPFLPSAGVALLLAGCTSVVAGPREPADPTTMFVLREALHVGLVLPDEHTPPRRYREYGYGEWEFYARGNNPWYRVLPALFAATPGTLSRREFVADGPARLRAVLPRAIELDAVVVARADVDRLRARLEAEFGEPHEPNIRYPQYDTHFIPDDRTFWLGHMCAEVATGWLRELGCTVTYAPFRARLEVER